MKPIVKDRAKLLHVMDSVISSMREMDYAPGWLSVIIDNIRKDSKKEFLSISQTEMFKVSYYHSGDKNKLTTISLGKYLTRNGAYSGTALDNFVQDVWVKLMNLKDLKVKILRGKDIMEHYLTSDTKSCMAGSNAWKVGIYTVNPEVVGLVVMDNIRALLWTCMDGTVVLDRCYPSGHWKIKFLHKWAASKKYIWRVEDGLVDEALVELSDDSKRTVSLKKFFLTEDLCKDDRLETNDYFINSPVYPYFDTFAFTCLDEIDGINNTIKVSNDGYKADVVFHDIDGNHKLFQACEECNTILINGNSCEECTCQCGDHSCDECNPDGCEDEHCSSCHPDGCKDEECEDCHPTENET